MLKISAFKYDFYKKVVSKSGVKFNLNLDNFLIPGWTVNPSTFVFSGSNPLLPTKKTGYNVNLFFYAKLIENKWIRTER